MTDSYRLRSERIRKANNARHAEVADELRELSARLCDVMRRLDGKSAMVRTFVDSRTGSPMCAFNVYGGPSSNVGLYDVSPLVEGREEVGA